MHEKTGQQFQQISYAGGGISVVGVAGLLAALVIKSKFASAASLAELFVLASVVGLIISTVALVLARKSSLPFWENLGAYVAASIGAILPSALILLHFARIVQRLMT
jgi:hypothetical protein